MKKILIISFSNIESDPRVMRQIITLKNDYHVSVLGFGPKPAEVETMITINNKPLTFIKKVFRAVGLLLSRYEWYYWTQDFVRSAHKALQSNIFDLIIANDIDALPLALKLANAAPVIFDAHEYAPAEHLDRFLWRLIKAPYKQYLCDQYIHAATGMMTVGEQIATEYRKRYAASPIVIYNAPYFTEQAPTPCSEPIRLIHHGAAIPSRQLEKMIEMMDMLDKRFEFDLILIKSNIAYYRLLEKLVKSNPRIRLIEPVPMREISTFINRYDIGVYCLAPVNFNHINALPNKFFEFIQARLAVVVSPNPEIANLTRQYKLGVVAEDFSAKAMADALNKLSKDDIQRFKENSNIAARELCYEKSAQLLKDMVKRLCG